ncbi:phage tail protein, partial [Pantoea sp. VH_3]|uniref:phage tail protein n=1 Tax=Pantoea sp. VH_3 TaxID=2608046 RepID=UPI0012328A4A
MAKKFASLMTEKGKTLIADAIAGGKVISLKYFAVGDGNGSEVTPSSSQTALVNEVARVEINSIKETDAAGQVVAAEAIIPADKGGFWIREAGIFTSDGVLVAVSQTPVSYKPAASEGASSSQIVRMMMAISNASAVNITVDDSLVIATEDFVNSRLKEHEKSRNHPDGTLKDKGFVQLSSATDSNDETRAATPKAVKAANDNAGTRLKASENLSDLTDSAKARKALALDKASNWMAVQANGGLHSSGNHHIYIDWATDNKLHVTVDETDEGALFTTANPPSAADADAVPMSGGTLHEEASLTVISSVKDGASGQSLYGPLFRSCMKGRGGDGDFKDGGDGASGQSLYGPLFRSCMKGRGGDGDFKDGGSVALRIVEVVSNYAFAEILFDGYGSIRSFQFRNDGTIRSPSSVYAGEAYIATDGNIYGSVWGGFLNNWIAGQISAQ